MKATFRAGGSGLVPTDLDAERMFVGGLIADPHGNATFPVEQFFDPRHQELISLSKPFRPTAGIESGP